MWDVGLLIEQSMIRLAFRASRLGFFLFNPLFMLDWRWTLLRGEGSYTCETGSNPAQWSRMASREGVIGMLESHNLKSCILWHLVQILRKG